MTAASGLTPKQPNPRITLIEDSQQRLAGVFQALRAHGFRPVVARLDEESGPWLVQSDLLLMDIHTARQPRTSRFMRVPAILVLTTNAEDTLPPWFKNSRAFIEPYPDKPAELASRLASFLPARRPKIQGEAYPPEQLSLLFSITQYLSGHLDLDDLFDRILELPTHLEAEYGALLLEESQGQLYYRSTFPGHEELTGVTGRRLARRLILQGIEGQVLRQQEAIIIHDTREDSRWLEAPYLPDSSYAVAALPIKLERVAAAGTFLLGHSQTGHFSQNDLALLGAAVTQISMALENALLFKNQAQRSVQLALINEAIQAATSILNNEIMLRTVVHAIQRSFAIHSVAVFLYNPDNNQIELQAKAAPNEFGAMFSPELDHTTVVEANQGLAGWAFARRQTALANDVLKDPRATQPEQSEIRAELCVPIIIGTKILGVLELQSTRRDAFDTYHVTALETLADQLAIAIENARLYDAFNQRVEELKTLNQIGQAITSTLNLRETLTLITDQTIRLLKVAAASVALIDEARNDVWFAAASGEGADTVIGIRIGRGQGIAGWVADQGEAVIVPDVTTDDRFYPDMDQQSGFTTRSIMCIPLQTKGHNIGALEVMNKQAGPFNDDDLALLQAIAAPAATAIENARLYEEKTRTIKRLAETQNQLIQSAKLAAVGELAAGVAHEINNPLTSIMGLTSLLLELPVGSTLDNPVRDDLEVVFTEAERARDIVRSLLNFARTETPKRKPTEFNRLVEEAVYLVYTKGVSQWVTLNQQLASLPEVPVDRNQIKQVLVNLLCNAVQAMQNNDDRPATLTISTRLVRAGEDETTVVVTVNDNGSGIAPENLNKVFDPFFTTKPVGEGTGLGLSISYGIIERHGGEILVESTPDQGTTFTVRLPVPDITVTQSEQPEAIFQRGPAF